MTVKAFNTGDVPRFRRVMTYTKVCTYIISTLHKSECSSISILMNVFAPKIFVCLNLTNLNIHICFTASYD